MCDVLTDVLCDMMLWCVVFCCDGMWCDVMGWNGMGWDVWCGPNFVRRKSLNPTSCHNDYRSKIFEVSPLVILRDVDVSLQKQSPDSTDVDIFDRAHRLMVRNFYRWTELKVVPSTRWPWPPPLNRTFVVSAFETTVKTCNILRVTGSPLQTSECSRSVYLLHRLGNQITLCLIGKDLFWEVENKKQIKNRATFTRSSSSACISTVSFWFNDYICTLR